MQDPFRYFRIEARELIDQLAQGLLDLEKAGGDAALVGRLLRAAHTLKGAARIVKQREIAEQAHALEDVLEPLRAGTPPLRLDAGFRTLDAAGDALAALPAPGAAPVAPKTSPVPVVAPAPAPAAEPAARPLAAGTGAPKTAPLPVFPPGTLATGLAPSRAVPVIAVPPELGASAAPVGASAVVELGRARARSITRPPIAVTTSIPIPTEAPRAEPSGLSELHGGLAEVHRLIDQLRANPDPRTLAHRLDQLDREIRAVRRDAERISLVRAGTLFTSLERTVRDASRRGERVDLACRGGDIRVESQVLAAVQPALVQLVRNAIAHGIEPAAERAADGKPAAGRIAIEVRAHGNRVTFACEDDGRGIDLDAVARAAGEAPGGDPDALLQRLLRGGISTAGRVTELSGRGIGLDIISDTARRLGGEVGARTRPGDGTAIWLTVPVAMAAATVLFVEAAGHRVALPIEAIRRVIQASADDVRAGVGGSAAIPFDDLALPFAPLARLLRGAPNAARRWPLVVVADGDQLAGLRVERLIGVDDVVVRPVPAQAPLDRLVRGVALDTDSLPRPVLDPAEVVRAVRASVPEAAVEPRRLEPILVVDDSLTTRMLQQSILESAGYEVELARSAEEGLEKLGRRPYSLILVDVEMPGMDGFAFVSTLRSRPAIASIPAVLVTSRNAPEDRRRGETVGARGYIVKGDFDQSALLTLIRRLVSE